MFQIQRVITSMVKEQEQIADGEYAGSAVVKIFNWNRKKLVARSDANF